MKKIWVLLVTVFAASFGLQGQNIKVFFGHTTHLSVNNNEPYIEVLLSFEANSLRFEEKPNGNYGARVESLLLLKEGDSIIYAEKQEIHSPEVNEPVFTNFSFMNLQRIALGNGMYNIELTLTDKVEKNSLPLIITEKILVNYPSNQMSMSDIQLIANLKKTETKNMFSKNGYDMEPFANDFIPERVNELRYYAEVYNADKSLPKNSPFSIFSYVETYETGKKLPDIAWQQKEKAKNINYILNGFKIGQLKRGNYNLVIEVLDSNNQLLTFKKIFFQRGGETSLRELDSIQRLTQDEFARSMTNDSLLTFFIKALIPVSWPNEQPFIKKGVETATLAEKQDFFQGFWEARNKENPEAEWSQYYERLLVVEANFSFRNRRHGYETDQGRVYLQYGPPNHIIDEKFKSSDAFRSLGKGYLPYQMWRYDLLPQNEKNRMFVFWCPQIAGEYDLLVSNAIGEVFFDDWEHRLSRGAIPIGEMGEAGRQFIRGF